MLLSANHEEKKIMVGRNVETVERGSLITSYKKLSERWGWKFNKTRDFIKMLEKENMVNIKSNNKSTTISIVNYSVYQNPQQEESITNQYQNNNKSITNQYQINTNNNVNNDNNINDNSNTNNIIDLSNKGSKKKSEACDAIKMMRQGYEERVNPQYSVWEEHQCSGTLDRLREEYDGVFDEKYVWMADQP